MNSHRPGAPARRPLPPPRPASPPPREPRPSAAPAAAPIRSDNQSGRCVACWKAKRVRSRLRRGVRQETEYGNRHGFVALQAGLAQRITAQLAVLAERPDNPITQEPVRSGYVEFTERRYSPTRAAAFEQALLAWGVGAPTPSSRKESAT